MGVLSQEEFKQGIKNYLTEKNLTVAELSVKVNRGRSTVNDWIHTGVKSEEMREKIVSENAWLFSEGKGEKSLTPSIKSTSVLEPSFLLVLKSELARPLISNLTGTLIWFLFDATAKERDYFRDTLGEDWKNFLELTRAMTGETAFEVTKQEGRLDWYKKK